jgi:hypothetical protein
MEEYRTCFETYEISNYGNLRKKLFNGEYKSIKGSIQNRGYYYFQVQRNKKRINLLFHHLVAEQFIGMRPEGLVIDHIDRNKLNNNVHNLRYITQKENCRNHDRYRSDIIETDLRKRNRIFTNEFAIKSGKNKQVNRKKGTGQIYQRNGSWRAIITINKIKYSKTLKSKDDAETYLHTISLEKSLKN